MGEKIEEIIGYILAVVVCISLVVVMPIAFVAVGIILGLLRLPDLWRWFAESSRPFKVFIACVAAFVLIIGAGIYNSVRYESFDTRSYASESYTVYKTYTGHCYHRSSCGYLRSCIETTKAEALREGLRPCSRCNP